LKDVELKSISELMKSSRRSDRELAKAIGVSQPTISRTIKRLEKEKLIKEYTMISQKTCALPKSWFGLSLSFASAQVAPENGTLSLTTHIPSFPVHRSISTILENARKMQLILQTRN